MGYISFCNLKMRLRNLVFTLNNYTEDQYNYILDLDLFKYLVIGKEISESGTPHLQGYATLVKQMAFNKVRKILHNSHIEPRKGSHVEASDYCKKGGDFVEIGTPPKPGERSDLACVAQKLRDGVDTTTIAKENTTTYIKFHRGIEYTCLKLQQAYSHDTTRGIWVYGPPGSGKSYSVRQQFPNLFLKPQSKWWDGYAGELNVLLDDLDTHVLGHYLKIWSDRYACTGETKGGTVHLRHHRFIVTSNSHPSELFTVENSSVHMCDAILRRFEIFKKNSMEESINYL